MKDEMDLAFVADALLALCEKPHDAPFFSERTLAAKQAQESTGEVIYLNFAAHKRYDHLLRTECLEVFEHAKLTPRQKEALIFRLNGWSFNDVARANNSTKQAAQRCFLQAIKKLSRALRVYPYTGLSEVYRAELRRGHKKAA